MAWHTRSASSCNGRKPEDTLNWDATRSPCTTRMRGSGGSSDSCPALVLPGPSLPEPQALGSHHIEHGGHPGSGDSYTRLQVHRDVLRLQVLLDALVAALAAEARLLDASEGRGR